MAREEEEEEDTRSVDDVVGVVVPVAAGKKGLVNACTPPFFWWGGGGGRGSEGKYASKISQKTRPPPKHSTINLMRTVQQFRFFFSTVQYTCTRLPAALKKILLGKKVKLRKLSSFFLLQKTTNSAEENGAQSPISTSTPEVDITLSS